MIGIRQSSKTQKLDMISDRSGPIGMPLWADTSLIHNLDTNLRIWIPYTRLARLVDRALRSCQAGSLQLADHGAGINREARRNMPNCTSWSRHTSTNGDWGPSGYAVAIGVRRQIQMVWEFRELKSGIMQLLSFLVTDSQGK